MFSLIIKRLSVNLSTNLGFPFYSITEVSIVSISLYGLASVEDHTIKVHDSYIVVVYLCYLLMHLSGVLISC